MSRFPAASACVAAALLLPAGAAAAADNTDPELEAVRVKVSGMFDAIEPQHVNASPIDGWYTVQKGSIVAYVSDDGRYLLQGDLIDLDSQVNLTEQSRSDARRDLLSGIEDDQAIMFSPAETRYTVTVFTDVECTYCRKLHSQIGEYMDQGIEIRYLFYPRNGPASSAWSTSEDVWCSRDRKNALTMAKLDREFQTSKCDASAVAKQYVIGENIGLSGTPAIVLEDGTLIDGYLPPAALKARIEATNRN
jgi:thiol:disulfide interchange protein DsbC